MPVDTSAKQPTTTLPSLAVAPARLPEIPTRDQDHDGKAVLQHRLYLSQHRTEPGNHRRSAYSSRSTTRSPRCSRRHGTPGDGACQISSPRGPPRPDSIFIQDTIAFPLTSTRLAVLSGSTLSYFLSYLSSDFCVFPGSVQRKEERDWSCALQLPSWASSGPHVPCSACVLLSSIKPMPPPQPSPCPSPTPWPPFPDVR
jgi:hypothetical protein